MTLQKNDYVMNITYSRVSSDKFMADKKRSGLFLAVNKKKHQIWIKKWSCLYLW